MKKTILITSICLLSLLTGKAQNKVTILENGLRFCEGSTPYRNTVLISNFGCEELDPLNNKAKGYIMAVDSESVKKTFIQADGSLSAPKGMGIANNKLYIADVAKVVVYDLNKTTATPQIINLPKEKTFVNDIVTMGELVLASVTNTGNIYYISKDGTSSPKLFGNIPGANGMAIYENLMVVASYNPTGTPDEENVIYCIDLASKNMESRKLIPNLKPGQYDGIAFSADGSTLYFTSWGDGKGGKAALYSYQMDGKSGVRTIDLGVELQGPADICIKNGNLYLPDLPASKVYVIEL